MAEPNMNVTVSVENIIQDAIRDMASRILTEFGVRIDNIQVKYMDVSTEKRYELKITEVVVGLSKRY